jgi:hypothetical protein
VKPPSHGEASLILAAHLGFSTCADVLCKDGLKGQRDTSPGQRPGLIAFGLSGRFQPFIMYFFLAKRRNIHFLSLILHYHQKTTL